MKILKREVATLSIIFFLLVSAALPDQTQKVYELIYEDVQVLKKQILAFQEKLQNLASELQVVRTQIDSLQSWLKNYEQEQAAQQQRLKDIPVQYQIVSDRLEQMSSRLDKLAEDLMALRMATPIPPATEAKSTPPTGGETQKPTRTEAPPLQQAPPNVSPPGPSPQELYNSAYNDYLKGNFDLAIEGFKLYREQFSESPLADNALYWVGECYFSQKKFTEAIAAFNDVILYYPKGDRVAAAYLKKGLSYIEMDQKEEALAVFKLLVSKFPLEEEARIAQQKIKELIEK